MMDLSVPLWLIMLPSVAVFCVVMMVAGVPKDVRLMRKRAQQVVLELREPPREGTAPAGRAAGGRRGPVKEPGLLDRLVNRVIPKHSGLRHRLARTGRAISPASYIVTCLLIGMVTAAVVVVVGRQPLMIAGAAGAGVGFGVPHMVVGWMAGRRRRRFVNNLPEAIDVIVRGVRSGLPVTESMAMVAREMGDPVGTEFRRTVDSYRLGRTLTVALTETARRLGVAEFDFLVVALSIQQETGGNLAETLNNLGDIIRKRRQMRLKIRALTGEARTSAWIVGSLPFILFGIINVLNPGYTDVLFNDPRGHQLVAGGLVSMMLGIGIMYKLSTFEI